jgi:sporulation protein YlmC with PRC-barrel domain
VNITDVHAFGSDAVTITDVSVVRSDVAIEPMREQLIELEHLLKRKVMTDAGTLVGQVAAVHFGDGSYKVAALDVIETESHKHVQIDTDRIQKIGEELIIVADRATAAVQPGQLKQALRVVTSRPVVHQDDSRSA